MTEVEHTICAKKPEDFACLTIETSSEISQEDVTSESPEQIITKSSSDDEKAELNAQKITEKPEESDNSDNEDLTHSTIQKKRMTLIDSDSESEQNVLNKPENVTRAPESENEDSEKENSTPNENETQKKKSRLYQLQDSDSENDHNLDKSPVHTPVQQLTFSSEDNLETVRTENQKSRLKMLCDSESSADENEDINTENVLPIKQKRVRKTAEPVEKKMSGRDAMEQRRQIKSESQRMVRESRVSLPYHRPKAHTLQDFLKRRSRIDDVIPVPPNTPTTFAIKMSSEQLKVTAKRLKEREEEIEKFYKSDSDSELEPEGKEINDKSGENLVTEKSDLITNVDTQNLEVVLENKPNDELNDKQELVQSTQKVTENATTPKEDEPLENHPKTQSVDENPNENVMETEPETSQVKDFGIDDENEQEKLKQLREVIEKYICGGETNEQTATTSAPATSEQVTSDLVSIEQNSEVLQSVEAKKVTPEKVESKLEQKLKKLNPLVSLKANFKPRLSGGPNDLVVLDDGLEKSKGVSDLMKRFLVHTAKKTVHKKNEVNILNIEHGVLRQETIVLQDAEEDDEEPAKKHQTPGAKMKKLREELEEQIAKKRLEEWKKRNEEKKLDNEDDAAFEGEKMDCGLLGDSVLDNEDEEEMTDSGTSSEEDEEEEEIEMPEKPRVKSAFVDDEAEDSDVENEDELEEENEDDVEDQDEDDDNPDDPSAKKQLKRIITTFNEDDSDDDTIRPESSLSRQRTVSVGTSRDLFTSQELNKQSWDEIDDDIPAYQPLRDGLEKTPCKPSTQSSKDITTFLTPTLHLTALQGMSSATKSLQGSPGINLSLPPEPSPLKSHPGLKTNLFGSDEPAEEDHNMDELEGLCSGKFTSVTVEEKTNVTSTQELIDICSGKFTGMTQNSKDPVNSQMENEKSGHDSFTLDLVNEESQDFRLTFEEDSMDKPPTNTNPATIETNTPHISSYSKFVIVSSSDEDQETTESSQKKKKLKKKRKKYIIDDISITDEEVDELNEDFSENENEDEETTARDVNYDSEENEIELEDEDDLEAKRKARDFFDAEAELSESEWGSADEDEKGLDDFEFEEGDIEKINEKKVQRELERMHAREVLDEDKREVRLLQELLLEDGEDHGSGRERKFRWKNADTLTWNDTDAPKDDDEDCEDIESELQWRKMRHERETFLNEQQTKKGVNADELIPDDSQIMKLGHAALKKSFSGLTQHKTTVTETVVKDPDVKLPFALVNKRGSFLARSETMLARLAEITRTTTGGLNNGPKNSRNFVFTSVEKSETTVVVENEKKRKAEEGTPKALKKLRIADMSPSVQKYKKKVPPK